MSRSDPFKIGNLVRVHSDIGGRHITGRITGTNNAGDYLVRLDMSGVQAHVPEAFLSHADAITRLGEVVGD